jgi:hypothetical protein
MPIDSNIALGIRPVEQPNMLAQMGQVMQLRQMQQENESQNALSNSYRQAYAGGKFDPQAVIKGLVDSGQGHLVPKVEAQMLKAEQDRASTKKTTVETLGKEYENARIGLQNVTDEAGYLNWIKAGFNNPAIAAHMKEVGLTPETALANAQATIAKEGLQTAIAKSSMGLGKFLEQDYQLKNAKDVAHIRNAPAFARLEAEKAAPAMTPDTINMAAEMFIKTGQLPPMGIGKSSAAIKTAILNRATEIQMGAAPKTTPAATESTANAAPVVNNLTPEAPAPVNALVPKTAAEAASFVINNKIDNRANAATVKAFTSGVEARRVTALNTAVAHLDTMKELADGLQNGDARLINSAANAISKQTGAAAPTNLAAAKQIVGAEIIKAIVANGGTGRERLEAEEKLAAANSPEQFAGVIKTYQELMTGQLDSLRTQYKSGTGRDDFNDKFLSPASKKVFLNRETASAPTPTASSGSTSVTLPDGKSLSFPNAEAAAKFKKAAGL